MTSYSSSSSPPPSSEPNHDEIYRSQAEQYDRLIAAQPLLGSRINAIRPLAGLDVVDLGAGSGRLTLPLAAMARSVLAVDLSSAMLEVAASRLTASGADNWRTAVGTHLRIPAGDASADLVVSGWSIAYSAASDTDPDGSALAAILDEIRRVLRPGGTVVIFETMGTGFATPNPPVFLLNYYDSLERVHGFAHECFPFDYTFADAAEAERLARFFFGEETGDKVAASGSPIVPEFAGVWHRVYE
ncbi:class I SAM-dependent methyltransferase [Cohnella hashimotonis]|uniref:Class I SAM-dependent methyltransferase n=1 Tax=Cohnella hashimotonis TaxID=2826895 RepID=A0ABT6T9G2_9BACL|nr:class I SAM-dependent methyltransferase [Cohnella hashimotonis]MDI4643466.1 class I SAM-dependent methyltransferase [Cohnella hashimotonis]